MTKTEFIDFLAERYGIPRAAAEKALNAFLDSVEDALCKDGRVVLPGFGTLACRERKARSGRNPATGAIIGIPSTNAIIFQPAAALKELVSTGQHHAT